MRKMLLFLMVLFISFAGCSDITEDEKLPKNSGGLVPDYSFDPSQDDKPLSTISSKSETNRIFTRIEYLNILYPAYNDRKYYNLGDWQGYIKEKFDIDIAVNYKGISAEDILSGSSTGNSIIYLNFADSTVYQYNTAVLSYSDDNIAYDLSPYYIKYGWNEIIDPKYIDRLIINGKIFAIPAVESEYSIPRHYNKTLLEALGMEVPETIFDFYDFLKEAKKYNEGNDNYYPMFSLNAFLSISTSDIFRAYNVYLNSEYNSSVTFNPNTESFEDGVFSNNMEKALEFIRTLQQENLFAIGRLGMDSQASDASETNFLNGFHSIDKNFATEYGVVFDTRYNFFIREAKGQIDYDSEKGYYLIGTNSNNICEIRQDLAFYVFPKNIQNIEGTLELFDTVFNSSEYYADMRYGMEGIDYILSDDMIIQKPPKTGGSIALKQINSTIIENSSYVPESQSKVNYIEEDIGFEKNVFTQFFTYADKRTDLQSHMGDFILDSLFNQNLSPYDAIEEYKRLFVKAGRLNLINQLNENLGAVTTFNYSIND